MTVSDHATRIRHLLSRPKAEWAVIAGEAATVGGLYSRYVCILAAVGPVARLVGDTVFGLQGPIGVSRRPVANNLVEAAVTYVGWLVAVAVLALVVEALTPMFGGERNRVQAFKLAAYGLTPSMLAGLAALFPPVSFLAIAGFYSLYLLYRGLPVLMRIPEPRALGAFAALIGTLVLVGVVVFIVVGAAMVAST